jgi:hypothetical protein
VGFQLKPDKPVVCKADIILSAVAEQLTQYNVLPDEIDCPTFVNTSVPN